MRFSPRLPWLTILLVVSANCHAQTEKTQCQTPFEKSDGWDTPTYEQTIRFYRDLAESSDSVTLLEKGPTDSGRPLHLVLVSDPPVDPAKVTQDERSVLLINNAIHPGEPDGVDASMAFARDLALDNERYADALNKVIVAIIPMYNIGGALNRNRHSRANQNGPREYGFRGNARNYDLNRDFIKCDTLNARSFAQIFHSLDPDLFLDTHVSNGSDYQYVMTTAHSQKDKLGYELGNHLHKDFEPTLFKRMRAAGFPTVPYVNSGGRPPDQGGFTQFLETPRYSTGYAALFQTVGFMTETHMLKPYPQRVAATREFMEQSLALLAEKGNSIQDMRRRDRETYHRQEEVPIAWSVNRDNPSRIEFLGYEASRIDSKVTPGQRLFYDRNQPFAKNIPYYNDFQPSQSAKLPAGYLVPAQWHSVIELLRLNGVKMETLRISTELDVEIYHIEDVESRSSPYEGHYFHDNFNVFAHRETVMGNAGDILIPIHQDRARYVVETLEPMAMDSLFRWNYFDTILQRKEHFSPYVFEDNAEAMLQGDEKLQAEFEERCAKDPEFAESRRAQLQFLYERSKHNEAAYQKYPIVRLMHLPAQSAEESASNDPLPK